MLIEPTPTDLPGPRRIGSTVVVAPLVVALLVLLGAAVAPAQSVAGSRAGSEMIAEGSVLVASGSAELLSSGAELVVVSVHRTARGARLVLRPVAHALSETAAMSATVTIELSAAAWEAALHAAEASGHALHASSAAVGALVVAVPLAASTATAVAGTWVVGSALVIGEVVIGIVPGEALAEMMGRSVHRCRSHRP